MRVRLFASLVGSMLPALLPGLSGCSEELGPPAQPLAPCPDCTSGKFTRGALFPRPPDNSAPLWLSPDGLVLRAVANTIPEVARGDAAVEDLLRRVDATLGVTECGRFDLSADGPWDFPLYCDDLVGDPSGTRLVLANGRELNDLDDRYYRLVFGIGPDGKQRWRHQVPGTGGAASSAYLVADGHGGATVASSTSTGDVYEHLDQDGVVTPGSEPTASGGYTASDGTVFDFGSFTGTFALGGSVPPLQATGARALYISAVAADGTPRWSRKIESPSAQQEIVTFVVFADGRIALSGTFGGASLQLGDAAVTGGAAYVAQLDASGHTTFSLSAPAMPTFVDFAPTTTGFMGLGQAEVPGPLAFGGVQVAATTGIDTVLVGFAGNHATWLEQVGGPGHQEPDRLAAAPTGEIFAQITLRSGSFSQTELQANGTTLTGEGVFIGELTPGP